MPSIGTRPRKASSPELGILVPVEVYSLTRGHLAFWVFLIFKVQPAAIVPLHGQHVNIKSVGLCNLPVHCHQIAVESLMMPFTNLNCEGAELKGTALRALHFTAGPRGPRNGRISRKAVCEVPV